MRLEPPQFTPKQSLYTLTAIKLEIFQFTSINFQSLFVFFFFLSRRFERWKQMSGTKIVGSPGSRKGPGGAGIHGHCEGIGLGWDTWHGPSSSPLSERAYQAHESTSTRPKQRRPSRPIINCLRKGFCYLSRF